MNEKHVGRDLDDFLREEGLLEEVEAVATERVQAAEAREPSGRPPCPVEGPEPLGRRSGT